MKPKIMDANWLLLSQFFLFAWLAVGPLMSNSHGQPFDIATWNAKTVVKIQLRDQKPADAWQGRVLAIDRDSGCLLQTDQGFLQEVRWHDTLSAENLHKTFVPVSIEELASMYESADLDQHALTSEHYVVVYRGSPAYARWIIGLYERLYRGFYDYWNNLGAELTPPDFPLLVNVFENRTGYLKQAQNDGLRQAETMIGYYHLFSNHTVSYDLTHSQGRGSQAELSKSALIRQIRSSPGAERTIATIVHEAVHQLTYNSGLQTRKADNPIWLSEGIALFFESPDLTSTQGWSGIGKTNQYQLNALQHMSKPDDAPWIENLILNDQQFYSGETVELAYARSWGLTYYLIKSKPDQFVRYVYEISKLSPLTPMDSKSRADMFRRHFGNDLAELQRDLVRRLARLN